MTLDAKGQPVHENAVVQITDESHQWFPALLIVEELKGWGVMGYLYVVTNTQEPNGQAYIRVKTESFERIGTAIIVNNNEAEAGAGKSAAG